MKKTGLLNQPLSALIAGLGHTDMVLITDAGLSIPANIQRIDLAVSAGVPSFLDVVRGDARRNANQQRDCRERTG